MSETRCEFREAMYEQFARIGKAISSPKRLELLELLCQGERTVEVLAKEADISIANASQHLQALKAARLVEADKRGLFVVYRIAGEDVSDFLHSVQRLADRRLIEIRHMLNQYAESHPDLEPIDRETLRERIQSDCITLIDVRPREEYAAGHIPGALSLPLPELEEQIGSLPQDQEIVAYCRGTYCIMAMRAVEMLRQKGFRAVHLVDGINEWRESGFSVETGEE